MATRAFHFARECPSELGAVDGLDDIEQRDRLADLVGLERPDQVEPHIGEFPSEGGPLAGGLLHPFSPKTRCPATSAARTRSTG